MTTKTCTTCLHVSFIDRSWRGARRALCLAPESYTGTRASRCDDALTKQCAGAVLYQPKSATAQGPVPLDVGPLLNELARLDGVKVAVADFETFIATPLTNIADNCVGQIVEYQAHGNGISVSAGPRLRAGIARLCRGRK